MCYIDKSDWQDLNSSSILKKFVSLTGFELGSARLLSMNAIHYTTDTVNSVGKNGLFLYFKLCLILVVFCGGLKTIFRNKIRLIKSIEIFANFLTPKKFFDLKKFTFYFLTVTIFCFCSILISLIVFLLEHCLFCLSVKQN